MSTIKVELSVDTTDAGQISAFNNLMLAIGGHANPSFTLTEGVAPKPIGILNDPRIAAGRALEQHEEPIPETPKKKRRTKAEIEAEKAAATDSSEEDQEPEPVEKYFDAPDEEELPETDDQQENEAKTTEEEKPEKTKETVLSVEFLRGKVGEHVQGNPEKREQIKAELGKYSAASVSLLDEVHFENFYEFLKGL